MKKLNWAYISLVAFLVAAFTGWVLNIVAILGMSDILTGEGALRIVGIFIPPLGAVMGFI